MTEYETIQGDMFDRIAHKTMGDEKYKDLLMRENPAYLGTYIFPAGVKIRVPDVDAEERDEDALPPWRRVSG